MEISAFTKAATVAPRKVRIVADTIRKLKLEDALRTLAFMEKRGASVLEKTLKSAVANAKNRNVKEETLTIKSIDVLEGTPFKRFHPSTRGRVHPYKKRTSHIRIILEGTEAKEITK